MSIANELSCDVATAMLAHKGTDARADDGLTEVVLEVHTTLRLLTNEARRKRRSRSSAAAASGSRFAEDASGSY